MEVRIGVQNASREITLETEESGDAVAKAVAAAVDGTVFEITGTKGQRVVVPAGALAYVEIGEETKRRVGFGG